MTPDHTSDGASDEGLTRRGFVAAAGSAAAATTLAGCSGMTEQSFEASPVVLPRGDREELVLAETGRDSETVSREGPTGNVEVSITNHAGLYGRGPARGTPTVLEQFVSSVNETPGSGGAIHAVASDAGIDELPPLPYVSAESPVDGDHVGLVVPEGARGDDGVAPGRTMVTIPGKSIEQDAVTYEGDGPGAFFPSDAFFPGDIFLPGDTFFPGDIFFPGDTFSPDSLADFQVFVPNVDELLIQTPEVGIEELPEGAERVGSGESIETATTVFAFPGPGEYYPGPGEYTFPSEIYDRGRHLPLGGSTFGLGVLSTPDASVAGESANPLVGMETSELLQHEGVRRGLLKQSGFADSETLEWRAGPTAVGPDAGYLVGGREGTCMLLGNETRLRPFIGVVESEDGLWGVLLHVARVTDGDHVVAASAIRRPVGTVDGGMAAISRFVPERERPYSQLREFTAEVVGQLARQGGKGGDRV
jgi:hypothetical protein